MSASNHNWVCFDCRCVTRRAKTAAGIPKCRECGSDCACLGYKVAIPKKSDIKAWRALRLECRRRNRLAADNLAVERARVGHAAERRIAALRTRGQNRDREKVVRELRKKLRG